MKKWFQNIGEKMQTWMYGRYGYDELSRFLMIASFVCIFLSVFLPVFSALALAMLVWSMIRTYSRNIEGRRKERDAYLRFTGKFKQFFKIRKSMWRDRKTHRYFKCPGCKTYMRVPKGKGKIEITCPKCKNKITKQA